MYEITEMPLPVNGNRKSTDGDGKLGSHGFDHAESNSGGGDVPRAATAADRTPKAVSFLAVDRRQSGRFRWRDRSENDEDELRNKIQAVARPKSVH